MNFCHYTPDYDSYSNLPAWAKETLEEHTKDPREYVYSREQLETPRRTTSTGTRR